MEKAAQEKTRGPGGDASLLGSKADCHNLKMHRLLLRLPLNPEPQKGETEARDRTPVALSPKKLQNSKPSNATRTLKTPRKHSQALRTYLKTTKT